MVDYDELLKQIPKEINENISADLIEKWLEHDRDEIEKEQILQDLLDEISDTELVAMIQKARQDIAAGAEGIPLIEDANSR